jgi:hypothetical protein
MTTSSSIRVKPCRPGFGERFMRGSPDDKNDG